MLWAASPLTVNLITLAAGAALTALLGGLLAPWAKGRMDETKRRRDELLRSSSELLDSLAEGLWRYWKLAQRLAFCGARLKSNPEAHQDALRAWDSGEGWAIDCSIQVEVSRARRLMSVSAHEKLVAAHSKVRLFRP